MGLVGRIAEGQLGGFILAEFARKLEESCPISQATLKH